MPWANELKGNFSKAMEVLEKTAENVVEHQRQLCSTNPMEWLN
ncbi:hypothetical protein [Alicyclobacillus kakegawensis]